MAYTLEPLPYASDALEPHFDKATMEIHHDRHHQAYVTNLNNATAGTEMEGLDLKELLANISKYPAPVRNMVVDILTTICFGIFFRQMVAASLQVH